MERWLGRWQDPIYAAFRIVIGLMLAQHGAQKVLGWFPKPGQPAKPFGDLPPQMQLGGVIELGCGLLVAIGLFGGWAAFLASGTMAVAYLQFHQFKGGEIQGVPIQNGGELAVAYCFAFLLIAARGSGAFSVDRARRRGSNPA